MSQNNMDLMSEEEKTLLAKTRKVRVDIIDELTEDGTPNKSGDIRVLNETMDALDRQVMDNVKLRQKASEGESNSAIVSLVAEVLSRVGSNPKQISNTVIELPDDFIPVDIVPGEVEVAPAQLDLSDFIKGDEDE